MLFSLANLGVALALLAWIAVGTLLVRRAERDLSANKLPPPWPALALAVALAVLAFVLRPVPQAALCAVACTMLVIAAGADQRTGYIFDVLTLPATLVVLVIAVATQTTTMAAWGVALLVGIFGSVVALTRGRTLGLGDVKAMYALGAAFGPLESLIAIFVAAVSGIVVATVAGRLRRGSELSFGPHLAVGATFALVAGAPLAHRLMGV